MATEVPIACTLSANELPGRLEAARALGEQALTGVEVTGRRALLRFDGHRDDVDALVEAESGCCSFFEFDVRETDDEVEVEILTPDGGELVLRGLVAGVVAGWDQGLR